MLKFKSTATATQGAKPTPTPVAPSRPVAPQRSLVVQNGYKWPGKMNELASVVFYGPTTSGKTTALSDFMLTHIKMLSDMGVASDMVLIRPGLKGVVNNDYAWIPEGNKILEWDEELIKALVDKQTVIHNAHMNNGSRPPQLFLIFDDFMGCGDVHKSKYFPQLATQCRHIHITLIWAVHKITGVPPVIRDNASLVFCTKLTSSIAPYCKLTGCDTLLAKKLATKSVNYVFVAWHPNEPTDFRLVKFNQR